MPNSSKPAVYSIRKSWRLPVIFISSSRSYRIFAVELFRTAAIAQAHARAFPWLSLPPNPPPIRRTSTLMRFMSRPNVSATLC